MTTPTLPKVDDATRREFLAMLTAAGLLAGCGNREVNDTSAPGAQERTLIDDRGEVKLAGVPQRIVALYEESVELIVALGLKPVGVGSSRLDATQSDRVFEGYYLTSQQIGSPTFVGSDPFNLEAITAVDPDLILPGFPDAAGNFSPTVARRGNSATDLRTSGVGQEGLMKRRSCSCRSCATSDTWRETVPKPRATPAHCRRRPLRGRSGAPASLRARPTAPPTGRM